MDERAAQLLRSLRDVGVPDSEIEAVIFHRILYACEQDDREVLSAARDAFRAERRRTSHCGEVSSLIARICRGERLYASACAVMEETVDAFAAFTAAFDVERDRHAKRRLAQHIVWFSAYGPAVRFLNG